METSQQTQSRIGRDFNFWQLIRFILPTLATSLFLSVFKTIDDGLFVSNYVGKNALSAINIVFPFGMLTGGFAIMFAAGGSAVCARKMGEGKPELAKRDFTGVTLIALATGVLIAILGITFQEPILRMLGATDLLMEDCKTYSSILWLAQPISMLCPLFDFFYSTAGKPHYAMVSSLLNGAMNIIFDIIFIVELEWGIKGAALSTVLGDLAVCLWGLNFYTRRKHEICFAKPERHMLRLLGSVCGTGISQLVNHVAMSISSFVANMVMLRLVGEDGIAAYSILGYLHYMLVSAFIGFADGIAPVFSFNFGARNKERIRRYFWYAVKFIAVLSVVIVAGCFLFSKPLISIYVSEGREPELFAMVLQGMHIFPVTFLFSGFCIFATGMFAALSDGKNSSIISFLRNCVFSILPIIVLPMLWGMSGVWLAVPVGECLSFFVTLIVLYANRNNYGYGKKNIALLIDSQD